MLSYRKFVDSVQCVQLQSATPQYLGHTIDPSNVCNKEDGQCLCMEGYSGRHCNECSVGYSGYPNCQIPGL